MISFVSTFPPIMCGIGTYTEYVVRHMPRDKWSVNAFELDEFSRIREDAGEIPDPRVDYHISLEHPSLPMTVDGEVLWFQHSFGMWGRVNTHFLKLIEEGKRKGKKVVGSFHTIHFESGETPFGMTREEWEVLAEALPVLDGATVFSLGAYRAVVEAFPRYREKVAVLRHGVHSHPPIGKEEARKRLVDYLTREARIPLRQKAELKRVERLLASPNTILLGNYGFVTPDKAPLQLFELGRLLQDRLPHHRVVTLFVGKVQERKDRDPKETLPVLEALKSVHNGRTNLFFEDYIPEEIFPLAFKALDFAVFWCHNATQSGRMAHAQGTGVPIVGRRWEGVGETLVLSGLPVAETLSEMADKVAEIVWDPRLAEEMQRASRRYAERFSFLNQAKKHLVFAESLIAGMRLPILDGGAEDDLHTRAIGHRRFWRYGTSWDRDRVYAERG